MSLSMILKKGMSGIIVAAVAVWLAGCNDTSSTQKPSTTGGASGKPTGSSESSAAGKGAPAHAGQVNKAESQAGSTTGEGAEVPEPAPADGATADEKSAGEKADSE